MEENILKTEFLNKIILNYFAEDKKKVSVTAELRYTDKETCYFGFPMPLKYIQPKKKSEVEIVAYTENGLYKSKTRLIDESSSYNEIFFEVKSPTNWSCLQMRAGLRKDIELPITIRFQEDFVLEATTSNLSVGGISFVARKSIPSVYQRLACTITITFPDSVLINFKDNKLTVTGKMIRCKDMGCGESFCACSFVALPPQVKETLKNYIMVQR